MGRSQSFVSHIESASRDFSRSTVELVVSALTNGLSDAERQALSISLHNAAGLAERPGGAPSAVTAPGPALDHLLRIGRDADLSVFSRIPAWGRATGSMLSVAEPSAMYGSALDMLPNNVRAIELSGDSMEPQYSSGDILFVQETLEAHDGDEVIAIAGIMDGITCKVYRNRDGESYLEPYNGEGRIYDFLIAGVVTGYFRKKRRK